MTCHLLIGPLQRLLLELAIASGEGQRLTAELKSSGRSRAAAGERVVFLLLSPSFFLFLDLAAAEVIRPVGNTTARKDYLRAVTVSVSAGHAG